MAFLKRTERILSDKLFLIVVTMLLMLGMCQAFFEDYLKDPREL